MGLFEREINEIRQKIKEVEGWTHLPKEDRLKLQLQMYGITTKKGTLIIQGLALGHKIGKSFDAKMKSTGMYPDTLIHDITPEEAANERVACEDQNKIISRAECKERLSSAEHFEQCQQCPNSAITRRLLVQTLDGRTLPMTGERSCGK